MAAKILFLAVNAANSSRLQFDEEVRDIKAVLNRAKTQEPFEIVTEWVIRVEDLRRALLEHEPTIVHFSGHGLGNDGLNFENDSKQVELVGTEVLAELFGLFRDTIKCVLLDGCYSQAQAVEISQHINYVISISQAMGNVAATEFAVGFYEALASGRSYEDSFQFGRISIELQGIPASELFLFIKAQQN